MSYEHLNLMSRTQFRFINGVFISFDEEIEENVGFANEYCQTDHFFVRNVTKAMARRKKKQLMHFPNRTSTNVIKENQETITLRGVKTNKSYECRVITSDRADYEKYLGNDWFKFLKDCRSCKGDRLLLQVQEPQTVMLVELIRSNDLP